MKRWLTWIFALLGVVVLLLVALLVLPFVIDFNRFKPYIQTAVSERMNARVDFSSARLTVLTGLGVRLNDVVVENTDPEFQGTKLFAVKELMFRAELLPLLRKRFEGYVLIDNPEIVVATKGLKNNLASLMKPSEGEAEKPAAEKTEHAPKSGQPPIDLKKDVVLKAIRITNAAFTMRNLGKTTVEPVRVRDLNLSVTNIGLDRDIKVLFSTKADVSQPGIEVHGPIELDATTRVNVSLEKQALETATFAAALKFDALSINARNAFVKKPGIPLNLKLNGSATPNTVTVESFQFNLHTLALALQATVSDLKSLRTDAKLQLLAKNLQDLGEVLPQHKALLTNARIDLDASANGAFKEPQTVKAALALNTVLGASDLSVDAKLDGMQPPKASVAVVSRKLDVGALVKPFLPPPGEKSTAPKPATAPASESKGSAPGTSEAGLPPEVKKLLDGALVTVKVNLAEILYESFRVENFVVDFKQESLNSHLEKLALKTMDVALDVNALANLGPTPPTVQTRLSLNAGKINVNELMAKLGIEPAPRNETPAATTQTAPATPATSEPAPEFSLTEEQKKLLRGVSAGLAVRIAGIAYDKTSLENVVLDAQVADLNAAVEKLSVSGFGGVVDFAGDVNLAASPLTYKAKVGLRQIRVEQLVEFVKPEHKDLVKGAATILLDANGIGVTKANIEKNLNAVGTFAMANGEIHSQSLAGLAQTEFDKFVGGLSVVAVADDGFKAAEKILDNPLAKQALGNSNFDISKIKADYERIKNVKVADKAAFDKQLKDVQGTLKIEKGRIHITSRKAAADGTMNMDVSVGLDTSLGGGAVYGFSPAVKARMLSQSKHAALLFDEKGNLDLSMVVGGLVADPSVKIDFNPLRDRFVRNAKASVEKEVRKTAEDFLNKALKGKVDAAATELKRKLAEEAAKRQAELRKAQDEAEKKANEAKAKAEAEAKKKVDAEKGKVQEQGKKALKGLFGK